jgi:hypothetical protein
MLHAVRAGLPNSSILASAKELKNALANESLDKRTSHQKFLWAHLQPDEHGVVPQGIWQAHRSVDGTE